MELGENLYAMLLSQDFARYLHSSKTFPDPKTATTGWVCLSCDSREEVDARVAKDQSRWRLASRSEPQDHGFMYGHGFEDLDGHHWELVHMSGMPSQA